MGCGSSKDAEYEEFNEESEEIIENLSSQDWIFENIVVEGGSSNGTVFIGSYKALEETGVLNKLKNFAGTSSGSLMATIMALQMPWEKVEKIFMEYIFSSQKCKKLDKLDNCI